MCLWTSRHKNYKKCHSECTPYCKLYSSERCRFHKNANVSFCCIVIANRKKTNEEKQLPLLLYTIASNAMHMDVEVKRPSEAIKHWCKKQLRKKHSRKHFERSNTQASHDNRIFDFRNATICYGYYGWPRATLTCFRYWNQNISAMAAISVWNFGIYAVCL